MGLLNFMVVNHSLMSFGMGDISRGLLNYFMMYWLRSFYDLFKLSLSPGLSLLINSTSPTYLTFPFNVNGVDLFPPQFSYPVSITVTISISAPSWIWSSASPGLLSLISLTCTRVISLMRHSVGHLWSWHNFYWG